ncbi:MAG: type II toxin-antitoxin system PemK/MazF family toxin, partial [Chlorobi bacterium]|nr:type II toxin-antitoxin system PemK/MazF family toxin [Chlorobiota bacterium]
VPITSKTGRLYPSEAYIEVNGRQGKAMADQLTTVSKLRIKNLICKLPESDMRKVERVIKTQLSL